MTTFTFDDSIVSDLHKDAYGYRPSVSFWVEWKAASNEQKQKIWDNLFILNDEEMERERRVENSQLVKWNSYINQLMMDNNISRATAIRWDMQSIDCGDDVSYYCYHWGLHYSNEVEIVEELKKG